MENENSSAWSSALSVLLPTALFLGIAIVAHLAR